MSVNGIQGYSQVDAYQAYNSVKKSTNEKKSEETSSSSSAQKAAETGVIYEKSSEASKSLDKSGVIYKPNTALINQLKADQDANKQRLMDMVHDTTVWCYAYQMKTVCATCFICFYDVF